MIIYMETTKGTNTMNAMTDIANQIIIDQQERWERISREAQQIISAVLYGNGLQKVTKTNLKKVIAFQKRTVKASEFWMSKNEPKLAQNNMTRALEATKAADKMISHLAAQAK